MSAFLPRPSVLRLRERLAIRLALVSLSGIALLLGAVGLAAWLAAASAGAALQAIDHGLPVRTLAWIAVGLALAWLASWGLGAMLRLAPRAEGVPLTRQSAEELFRLIDELSERAGIPPLHHLRITEDINAAVVQRPSIGLGGRLRTELQIGLPLVHGLSPMQFGAVLAHELGHIAAQRLGWCGWGAFLRAWWMRILDALALNLPARLRWLESRIDGYCRHMLRLARVEELEADSVAARLVGAELVGQTLVELSRKAHFLRHDYWPRHQALRVAGCSSALRPYREMGCGFATAYPCVALACAQAVGDGECRPDPFHPSLRRRLRALRFAGQGPATRPGTAADQYLGGALPGLARVFDRAWDELVHCKRHPMVAGRGGADEPRD